MHINKDTYEMQSRLARYCRTNEEPVLPGVTSNRLKHYRRLVYNVIDDTMDGAFPITRKLLNDEEWHELVNDFFKNHACQTPSVWKLPFELYEYVAEKDLAIKQRYPFLTDLLFFEWLEIEVHTMPDQVQDSYTEQGSWLNETVVINKEFRLAQLNYPVHQFKPEELKENNRRGSYFALIYREQGSGNVQFFNLSPLYAYLITQLGETQKKLGDVIDLVCNLFQLQRGTGIDDTIIAFLEHLKQKGFVLGFAA